MKKFLALLLSTVLMLSVLIVPINISAETIDWSAELDDKYVFDFTNEGYYADKPLKSGQTHFDSTLPFEYGAVTFDAGMGRGNRSVYPQLGTYSLTQDWGPQAWSQPGSVTLEDGTEVNTLELHPLHNSYFVPLKEDGTPFELAPNHRYNVKYSFYIDIGSPSNQMLEACAGLTNHVVVDTSTNYNTICYNDVRFGWIYGKSQQIFSGSFNIDTIKSTDESYDAATNTISKTVGGVDYILDNYLYFVFSGAVHEKSVVVDVISLEITRDDYTPKGTVNYYNGEELVKSEKVATGSYTPSYTPEDTSEKIFAGWYTEPELTNKVSSITVEELGAINLYAKWEKLGNWDTDLDKRYIFDFTNEDYYADAADTSNDNLNDAYNWKYSLTFNAGFTRGDRTIKPVYTAFSEHGWGSQAWSQPGSATIDGEEVNTYAVQTNHSNFTAYFVPLKEDRKPFELAPGHKYTINVKYYIEAEDASATPYIEYCAGLCTDKAPPIDYTSSLNNIKFAGGRFAWLDGETGLTKEATLSLDLTSLASVENYDYTTNTYKLTYSNVEYTLNNYFYFALTKGTATVHFVSLDITRDDYVALGTVEYYDRESLIKTEEVNIGSYTPSYAPTKDGYVFAGWCSDAELNNIVANINVVENTAIKLYAKWEKLGNWDEDLDKHYIFDIANAGYYSDKTHNANQINSNTYLFDTSKPFQYGAITFNAGYGRGNRTIYPAHSVYSFVTDWGPQAYYHQNTIELDGETVNTVKVFRGNNAIFAPIKADGKPFELAPGHKYSVKIKYYVTSVSGSPMFEMYAGMPSEAISTDGLYWNGQGVTFRSNYKNVRFGWLGSRVNTVQEHTLTLDTTSLLTDENYDYTTNTYTHTYNGSSITLYNYLNFGLVNNPATVDIISLEITRDDYVETRTGDVVYYDEDGITVINNETVIIGDYTIDYVPEAPEGKYFMGWYTDEALTNKAGSTVTLTEAGIKLYSKWERDGNWDTDLDKHYVFDLTNEEYYADKPLKEGQTLFDSTLDWNYGKISYNAGYGRGERSFYPVCGIFSISHDWGPQAWMRPGSVTVEDKTVNTLSLVKNGTNPSYFAPLKEDGTPFELAPGHKYTVKYKFHITSVTEGSKPMIEAYAGLPSDGVTSASYDYSTNLLRPAYYNARFAWIYTTEVGNIEEGTITIDTTSLLEDENYDYKTNTYSLTANGVDYTLYNYLYFGVSVGECTIDFISLEVTRDDYSEVKDGQFLASDSVANNTTYMVSFDYALKNQLESDINIGFKTTDANGNVPTYIEGKNVPIYKILADKEVGKVYTAKILLTTDMYASLFKNNIGFNDELVAANSKLFGYIIGDNSDVYIRNIKVTPLSDCQGNDLIGVTGAQVLTDDAVAAAGGLQAMRFTFNYDTRNGNDIYIDGNYYTVKARGFIYANGNAYTTDNMYFGDINLTNAKLNKYSYRIKSTDLSNCWTAVALDEPIFNIGYSTYVIKFAVDDTRELMAKGFVIVEVDGQEFAIYSDSITRSVDYVKNSGTSNYDPTVRQLVWGYDFSTMADTTDVAAVTDFHQNLNQNSFNIHEGDNRLATIGGNNWTIEDGVMKLKISKSTTDGYMYDIPMTVSTRNEMSFKYGKLELEAEIPYEYGVHAGFWTVPQNTSNSGSYEYVGAEFDIFEVDGIYNPTNPKDTNAANFKAVPVSNLHKWYKYYDAETDNYVTTTANIGALTYSNDVLTTGDIFGDYIASNLHCKKNGNYMSLEEGRQKHKYAVEWTPEYISYLIDDEEYFRINISDEYDFYIDGHENSVGMDCFHKAQNILFSFAPRWNSDTWGKGGELNNASYYDSNYENGVLDVTSNGSDVIEFKIHSIKLYQHAGETISYH